MKRPAVFAACALALAFVTAMLVRNYTVSSIQTAGGGAPAQPVESTQLVVATQDLALGTRIEERHVKVVPWPAEAIPAGAARDVQSVVGKVTLASVVANEPLMPQKLAAADTQGLMALVIPPGMRAVSVPVNKVTGISGFVSPGTRVDVLCVIAQRGDANGGRRAFTLLQDVKVLAVNQTLDERETKPTTADTVTLLVSPEDAHKLTLASSEGTLQLALRNYGDGEPSDAPGTTTGELNGVTVAKSNSVQVELIRGPDRVVEHF